MNKIAKNIVNTHFVCHQCSYRNSCEFYNGSDNSFELCLCPADEFSYGIHAAYKRLADMPFDEAMKEIAEYNQQ